jgi:hypothetical protein
MNKNDISAWHWALAGVQKDFSAAYAEFRAALREIWDEAMESRLAEAYRRYGEAAQAAAQNPDLGSNALRAHESYVAELRRALDENGARHRILEAYAAYLAALKQAWARLDSAAATPVDIAAICESIAWVSSLAGIAATPPNPFQ